MRDYKAVATTNTAPSSDKYILRTYPTFTVEYFPAFDDITSQKPSLNQKQIEIIQSLRICKNFNLTYPYLGNNQIFGFLVLRYGRFQIILIHPKKLFFLSFQKMSNVLKQIFVFLSFFFVRFLVFELWSILYFTFIVHSVLIRIQKKNYVRGYPPS